MKCTRFLSRSIVFFSCVSACLYGQSRKEIEQTFRDPPKQYRPMVRWWWPGGDVTDKEVQREIDILDQAGFGGAEIQPFVTFDTRVLSTEEAARVNDYATPQFFEHVRAAADAAKAHGMWIDDTFGSGWPFGGGAAITPELSAIELRFSDTAVEGPRSFTGKLTIPEWKPGLIASMMLQSGLKPDWPADWQQRIDARSKVVAVVALREVPAGPETNIGVGPRKPEMLEQHSAVVLTDRVSSDGTLDWKVPNGTWHIFVFRQIPTRQPVIGAAGAGPQLVLDHLNRAAFAAHAARVGEPMVAAVGPDVGSSLRAIFSDSLELQQYIFWSDDFLQQFKRRRGYDLTPYLAILRQAGYNDFYFSHPGGYPQFDVADGGDAIRADYWKTVSELIFEGFYHPFDEWATQHNLLSRVQAHGAPADIIRLYGDASIPETEQLAGGNTENFMKLASSAGYDYGRKLVSSESFVFRGNPYVTTPESIKANSDKLFISGINQIVYHGFPYDFDNGPKGIGWFPFQGQFSSHINEHNPIWPFIGTVNQYLTRMQYIAQQGTSDLQVAIFRSSPNDEDTGPTPASGPVKSPFQAMEDKLTSSGYSFGFVNEDVLLGSAVHNSQLITKGGGRFAVLMVAHETNVSPELVKALKSFVDAKLPVVFVGGLPGDDVSFKNMQQDRQRVASGLSEVSHAAGVMQAANETDVASKLLSVVSRQIQFSSGAVLPFVKKTIGQARFYLLTNPTDKATSTTVDFAERTMPEVWDVWTGSTHRAAFRRVGENVSIDVSLPPFGSELIEFDNSHRRADAPIVSTEFKHQSVGDAGWSIEAVGNSEKGIGIVEHLHMTKLTDWLDEPLLRTFSGRATYTTHVSMTEDDLKHATRILLDLGEVKDAAEIKVNGVAGATLIVRPFAADIRQLLHAGNNEIQVIVVNSLTNFVSTIQWPKNPFNPIPHYPPTSAGLLGPVELHYEGRYSHALP